MADYPDSIQSKVREILFHYRATPLQNGKTPSELYLGRQIRTKLDLIKPNIEKSANQNKNFGTKVRELQPNDRVQTRWYKQGNTPIWKFGKVVRKLWKLHYLVKLKRHIDQLASSKVEEPEILESPEKCNLPEKRVSFNLEEDSQTKGEPSIPEMIIQPAEEELQGSQQILEPQEPVRRSERERHRPNRLRDFIVS